MARTLAGAIFILFGVCVVIVMWGISPVAAVLGLALYGVVLAWRHTA